MRKTSMKDQLERALSNVENLTRDWRELDDSYALLRAENVRLKEAFDRVSSERERLIKANVAQAGEVTNWENQYNLSQTGLSRANSIIADLRTQLQSLTDARRVVVMDMNKDAANYDPNEYSTSTPKKPKVRIVQHMNLRGEVYYTVEHKWLWMWWENAKTFDLESAEKIAQNVSANSGKHVIKEYNT